MIREAVDVRELLEGDLAVFHLLPDRVGGLAPSIDPTVDSNCFQLRCQLELDFSDQAAVAFMQFGQAIIHGSIGFRLKPPEGMILQLIHHSAHAHPTSERCVDVKCFL